MADIISYNAAISACEFSAPLSLSLSLLHEALHLRLPVNVITCSAAISACEKASAWREALGLLGLLGESTASANLVTYNAAMAACERAMRWQQAGAVGAAASTRPGALGVKVLGLHPSLKVNKVDKDFFS